MLAEGRQGFASFQKLWKSKQLSIPLKCKLYRALVLSVVLYSSETWTMNKSTQRKLESFHTSCLRRILCLSYMERVTNEEVQARSRMSTLSAMIKIKRLKLFGHVLRMNDDRLVLRALTCEPTETYLYAKRAPGGQSKKLLDQLEEDCSRNNMSYITLRLSLFLYFFKFLKLSFQTVVGVVEVDWLQGETRGEIHPSVFNWHEFRGGFTGATEIENSPGAGFHLIVALIEEFVIYLCQSLFR